jgi:hypothetical protein
MTRAASFPHDPAVELALDRFLHAFAALATAGGVAWLFVAAARSGGLRQVIGLRLFERSSAQALLRPNIVRPMRVRGASVALFLLFGDGVAYSCGVDLQAQRRHCSTRGMFCWAQVCIGMRSPTRSSASTVHTWCA